jgi:hypothetical protein
MGGGDDDQHHVLMVDSSDRDYSKYPSPSSYRIDLPTPYRHVSSVRLLTCEIPCTFFVFSAASGNVTLRARLAAPGSATRIVTLPDGNYGSSTIADALVAAFNIAFAADSATFSVVVDSATLKMTIGCASSFVIDTTDARSSPTSWGLGYHLGLKKGEVQGGATTLTSASVMMLNPYTYLVLDIEGLGRIDECSQSGTGGGSSTAFAKIPIDGNSFGVIVASGRSCVASKRRFTPPIERVDRLYVKFRFHDGTPVDFHNVEHSFTLEFRT